MRPSVLDQEQAQILAVGGVPEADRDFRGAGAGMTREADQATAIRAERSVVGAGVVQGETNGARLCLADLEERRARALARQHKVAAIRAEVELVKGGAEI